MKKSNIFSLLLLLALTLSGCTSDEMSLDADVYSATRAQIQLNINTSGGTAYQSQLNELRLLMFDSETGDCVYNDLMTINSNDDLRNYANRKSLQFDALEFKKGTYDFLLLGNESSNISDLTAYRQALQEVKNINDLDSDVFQKIPFAYETKEHKGGLFGTKKKYTYHYHAPKGPLLLSAYQKNVEVVGGSRKEPQRIRATLVASLSLLEIVFVNPWEKIGLESPTQIPLTKRVDEIKLKNIVTHYSNPAFIEINPDNRIRQDLQFDFNIPEENYTQTEIARYQFYIPEAIVDKIILPPKTSIYLEGTDVKKEVTLQTNEKMYADDIQLYPRIFNERKEVARYIKGLEESFLDILFSSKTTVSYLRNIKYQLIVYLHPGDRDIDISLKVANWNVKYTTVNFNDEGRLEHTSITEEKLTRW